MRALLMMVCLACVGCESENISQCGWACKNGGTRMVSYSKTDGCRCSTVDGGAE